MRKVIIGIALLFCSGKLFADTYNNISIQGQLSQTTPMDGVKVHVLSDGQVVGTASDISLLPDAQGIFSTQTYITNPWVFKSGAEYVLRLSSPTTDEVISTFSITAVPFALTVRGNSQTGDQNYFAAYGNTGIGTGSPQYRLVVSSAGSDIMWVGDDGVHATKFTGDGSGLTNIGVGSTATQDLDMAGYKIGNAGDISGARFAIAGSTVVAILPGTGSLGVGIDAGRVNSGGNNTFLGYHAGYSNTSGVWNTFSGTGAGASNTEGIGNTFMGLSAGAATTTGSENTFLGLNSGVYNTSGSENTFLGSLTGNSNTTGRYNSFVGHQAGYGNTTGWSNIFIGEGSGLDNTSGSYNIGIGYDAGLTSPSAYFKMSLGDVLYGDLLDKTIGIGREDAAAALDIVSTGTASNIYAQVWRNGVGVVVASMTSQGTLFATLTASGDNLGNHTATTALNLAGNQILNISSLTVTGKDASGYSLSLSSGINMPGGTITAGLFDGNGAMLTALNASSLIGGTVADARLSSNVNLLNANQTVGGTKTFTSSVTVMANAFSIGGSTLVVVNGRVGISSAVPVAQLSVQGDVVMSSTLTVQTIMPANFVGGFMYFVSQSSACPAGWLKADGAYKSTTDYAALFGMIGYMYGQSGNNFRLPDMTDGPFVRATGGNASGQGTKQGYAVESHSHINQFGNLSTGSGSYGYLSISGVGNVYTAGPAVVGSLPMSSYGANETRPKNYAMIPCIKY